METVWDIGFIVAGLALLFGGGEVLVRGSVALSEHFGLSKLLVGLVVVGFGTSAPELLVSLQAALAGSPDIALGNVVGSNIANLLLIIGLAAVIAPVANHNTAIRRDLATMVAASVVLCLLFLTGAIGRPAGFGLFGALLVYLTASYLLEQRGSSGREAAGALAGPAPIVPLLSRPGPAALFAIIGIGALVLGANLMVTGSTNVARDFGVSEAVIGLTIVAIGTSLPELATAIVAARKGESEVILANVVGSNSFNILSIIGLTAIVAPIPVAERFALVDGPVMLAVAVAVALFLLVRNTIGRVAGGAFLVLYALYISAQSVV